MTHGPFTDKHALVIEDDALSAEVLVTLLHKNGVTSTTVASPMMLEQTISRQPAIDVIFLDLEFQSHDGFAVYHQIKRIPRTQDVPVIAYTVHSSEIGRARREGFHGFLGKPLDQDKFDDQLKRIMNAEPVWEI